MMSYLFQGERRQWTVCNNCGIISTSSDPFMVQSVSFPVGENCTLMGLSSYGDCSFDYRCSLRVIFFFFECAVNIVSFCNFEFNLDWYVG